MSDAHMDDLLKELQAELDVTPSPEFPAKVRDRIAESPASSRLPIWAMWGALSATAAGVMAILMTSTTSVAPPPVSVAPIAMSAPDTAGLKTGRSVPEETRGRSLTRVRPARKAPVTAPVTAAPVLEVITNQPALIRQAFQQAAALQRDSPVSQPAGPASLEPLTLSKVEIDPIVIPRGADAPSGGVSPVIRRVSADDATRSPR